MQVLVVEDNHAVRREIVSTLREMNPQLSVRQADSLQQTFETLAASPAIDLIILDLELLDSHGVDTLQRTREWCEQHEISARIVVLSGHDDRDLVVEVLRKHATGFIVKGVSADQFEDALSTTMKGRIYIPDKVLEFLLPSSEAMPKMSERPDGSFPIGLTEREQEICGWLANGLTYKEIARKLSKRDGRPPAENTVRVHVNNIAQKFGVKKNAKAGVMAALARFRIRAKHDASGE